MLIVNLGLHLEGRTRKKHVSLEGAPHCAFALADKEHVPEHLRQSLALVMHRSEELGTEHGDRTATLQAFSGAVHDDWCCTVWAALNFGSELVGHPILADMCMLDISCILLQVVAICLLVHNLISVHRQVALRQPSGQLDLERKAVISR